MVKNKTLASLIICVFVFCIQASHAVGATKPTLKTYGLKDLEKLALEKNAGVESARHFLDSLKGELGETRASFGPEFEFRYTYGFRNGKVTPDPLNKEHQIRGRLKQDLIQLFKTKPGKVKEVMAEVEGAESELKEAKRAALFELRQQYIDMLEEKTQADHYLRIKDIYLGLFAILKRRQLEKETLHSDVLEVEQVLIEAKESFLAFRNSFESSRSLLAMSLGLTPDEIEIRDIGFLPPLPSEEKLIHATISNRGEIALFEAYAKRDAAEASIAAYEELETEVYADYRFRKNKKGAWRSGPEVGINIKIPLAYRSMKNNRRKRFMAAKRFWEAEARNVAEAVKREISFAYEKYSLDNVRYLNAEKGVELKQEEMRIERARIENTVSTIEADRATLLSLEAEKTALDLERKLAEYEKIRGYYEVLYLVGVSQPEELDVYNYAGEKRRKPYPRSLWVWDVGRVLGNEKQQEFFVSFCNTKGIERVFLSINKQMAGSLYQNTVVSDFITKLHQNKIDVSALFGNSLWVYPRKRKQLINRIRLIVAYNATNGKEARFDGVHLDIEPHTLREWDTKRKELLGMLLDTYKAAREEIANDNTGLLLEVDLPTFYEKTDPSIIRKIAQVSDILTIMAYEKTTVGKVIKAVQPEVDAVTEADKGIIVGLNAKDFPDEVEMEELMFEVGNSLSASHSFLGFGIHDFDSYRTLAVK